MTDDPQGLDIQALMRDVRVFEALRRQQEDLAERAKSVRNRLMATLDEYGEVDSKGHRVLDLPEQVDTVTSLVAQRAVSRGLDPDVAEEILKSKPGSDDDEEFTLYDECIELVPVLNEDTILAARFEGRLTDEEIDRMFPTTESFRFSPKRVK